MHTDPSVPQSIAIVGAGYSGTLAAVQLLARGGATRIQLVERSGVFARGLAYRFDDDNLLLNVPAGNMSALADAPDDFVDFCRGVDPAFNAGSFVSRRLYGEYLQHTLAAAERAAPGRLQRVDAEVVAVQPAGTGFTLALADGRRLAADRVVLALGHHAPRDPLADFGVTSLSPWDPAALDALPHDRPVLLVGSGHTAIDVLFRLCSAAPARRVLMVSRHGLLPHGHRALPRAPAASGFPAWLDTAGTVRGVLRALRRQAAAREAAGGDWRDVLNELRPHTPALWRRLPLAERQRFLRQAVAFWDVHRHRLAPAAHRRLQGLLARGQAEHRAARVVAARPLAGGIEVTLRARGGAVLEPRLVGAIVNCTGPEMDLERLPAPLWRQLRADGLVRADALHIGLEVDAAYRVIGVTGRPVDGLHYLGPMLKASTWEAIAVPELRGHARALADALTTRKTLPLAA